MRFLARLFARPQELNCAPFTISDLPAATRPSLESCPVKSRTRIPAIGALLLVSASAALGTFWAYQSGAYHNVALGLALAGAALGGELLKPFAVAGAIDCLRAREWMRSLTCSALAVTCIVYSFAAALGLAAAGRGDLSAGRHNVSKMHEDARARRDRADAELRSLGTARTPAELEPLIARLLAVPGANGCRATPDTPSARKACADALALRSEAARSQRRTELESLIVEAERAAIGKAIGAADPLAVTLAAYLSAAGYKSHADAIAPWLALIPVLFLEIGSALALVAVRSMNLQPVRTMPVAAPVTPPALAPVADAPPLPQGESVAASDRDEPPSPPPAVQAVPALASGPRTRKSRRSVSHPLLDLLHKRGGTLEAGQRSIADALKLPKSTVNEMLHSLAAAGLIAVNATRAGTQVRLITA